MAKNRQWKRGNLWAVASLLVMAAGAAAGKPCEADERSARILDRWALESSDATLGFSARVSPLWRAITAEPDNVFLHHAYQRVFLNYIESVRMDAVEAAYQELLTAHPDTLPLRYAFARSLWGRRTADSKRMLEEVIRADPSFAWAHLAMARVYKNKAFEDVAKQREHIERFFALCPAPMAREAYELLGAMPVEFRIRVGTELRARLQQARTARDFEAFAALWPLEYLDTSRDRKALRAAAAADLVRMRAAGADSLALVRVMLDGYEMLEDREGARWARERITALAPHSFPACNIAIKRWYSDRARPNLESSREKVQGYYRELLEASERWIAMCPLYEDGWASRFRALRELPDVPAPALVATAEGWLRATASNSSNSFVAPSIQMGKVLLARGVGQELIPVLTARQAQDTAARLEADKKLDWFPRSWKAENVVAANEGAISARLLTIQKLLREKKTEEAERELAEAERLAADAAGDREFWAMLPPLISAYLEMGAVTKAESALSRLRAWLAANPAAPGNRYELTERREREATVWELTARSAKNESEATAAYRKVLALRSGWETLAERFEVMDRVGGRWEAVGGEVAGMWDPIERKLDGFARTDLQGRKWTGESLRGKVTLINFWATWCGPCVAELPYVQRIAGAVKDRKDVQVITLNIDEHVERIEPFLREHGVALLTVIPAAEYVEQTLRLNGFPRTWIVDRDGVARREQSGFTGEPAKWVEQVAAALR